MWPSERSSYLDNSTWTAAQLAALMQASRADEPAFLNGGERKEDAARMHALSKEYSLQIEFTGERDKGFIAGIDVRIDDAQGKTVFHLADAGPIMLVHLAPGGYRVTARVDGRCETQTATIQSHGTSTLCFQCRGEFRSARLHPSSVPADR